MSFGDHLEDLRRRLIFGLLGLAPIVIISLIFGKQLLAFLAHPLQRELQAAGQQAALIQTGLLETFTAYLKISMVAGVLVGSPWVLYQLWLFIAPGLHAMEKRFVHLLIPLSTVLTLSSACFLYFAVLPIVMSFFINFGTQIGRERVTFLDEQPAITFPQFPVLEADPPDPQPGDTWVNTHVQQLRICFIDAHGNQRTLGSPLVNTAGVLPQIRVSEYLGLLLTLALAFAIAFQTPVIVLLLGWAGIVERKWLGKNRKYAVLVAAVMGAILTPADPISMLMMAFPLYFLFELGMLLLILFPPGGGNQPLTVEVPEDRDERHTD